jgi:hypothetical protein
MKFLYYLQYLLFNKNNKNIINLLIADSPKNGSMLLIKFGGKIKKIISHYLVIQ